METTTEKQTVDQNDVKLPKQVYQFRVKESEKRDAQSGAPMIVHKLEIIDAKPIKVGDQLVEIDGLEVTKFTVLSPKAMKFANIERKALGLPPVENENEVLTEDYKGLTGYGIASSKSKPQVNDIDGSPLLHPRTGQPLVSWNRQLEEWIP